MRFAVTNELRRNKYFCGLLVFFHVSTALFLGLNVFLEAHRWGALPGELISKINGNAELFISPMLLSEVIAQLHIELFIHMFVLVMVVLVNLQTPLRDWIKTTGLLLASSSCLLNIIFPILVKLDFMALFSAFGKILVFNVFSITLLLITVYNLFILIRWLRDE